MDARERVALGRTGLSLTRLGLGGAPLGGLFREVADTEAAATVERAYALGLRLFDTAPLYGSGLAEQRLGRGLQGRPRGDFVLSTKVGRLLEPGHPDANSAFKGTPPVVPVFDFSYDATLRSIEASLERLGLDRVDILLIHDPDDHYEQALMGAYRALHELRAQGVVRAIGAGMNQAEMLARLARETDLDCFLVAGRYTLLDQVALSKLLPLCEERGIAVLIGGVFNSGILADPARGATFNYRPAPEEWLERAQRIAAVCQRWKVPLKAAALQFPTGHPAVASILIGCRSPEEVDENVRMFELDLPGALWSELKAEGLLPANAPAPREREART
jgi:D-threo-aldose 1-dehydrogenase